MVKTEQRRKCIVSEVCGACTMQGISYEKQLQRKQERVERLFSSMHKVNRIIGADDPYNYRNKSQISFGYDDKRNIIAGNYIESTHIIVPVRECQLVNKEANEIFSDIIRLVKKYHVPVFDERRMSGLLRHVLIRNSFDGEQIMVVLVTGNGRFDAHGRFIEELIRKHPGITTVVQNINSRFTSMVLGKKNYVLYGKGYIIDELCGYTFKISPSSFYQINHAQTEKLYRKAIEIADIRNDEAVLDAYCGIGTIGIIASDQAKQVIGVEINEQAIRDAVNNARYNKIGNIRFIAEDASRFMSTCKDRIDVLIMDPPRAGSDHRFLANAVKLGVKKIVYISCNPDTQYRDVRYLLKRGYSINEIQPFDLFPFTDHIENVVLLTLKNEKKYQNAFKIGEDSMVATVHEFKTKDDGSLTIEREREFKSTYYVKK